MVEIAKSNEEELNVTDIKNVDVQNLTDQEISDLTDGILSNPDNIRQVKVFPDLWDSLDDSQKKEFVSRLEGEIRDAIDELKSLGIEEQEYSPEVTKEDEQKIADLNFVRENKEKIPQSWSKLEMKAKEVAVEIKNDIEKEGLDRNLNP